MNRDVNRRNGTLDRRRFIGLGLSAVAATLGPRGIFAADEPATADRLIAGKDRRLIVHKAGPCEIETPLELLRSEAVTPAELMFVRSNQQLPWSQTLEPAKADNWKIELAGLLEFPRSIPLAEIASLPQVVHEMVLQCSGNGRAMFSRAAPVKGAPWRHGAMANVRFRGVPVRTVLEKFDVRPSSSAKFLTAEGADAPAKPTEADFEHSLPLTDVLNRSILAFEMNDKPMPSVHGGPVRLVTPGYYGTMHLKWLSRLRFEAQETVNHHQVKRYRTPLHPIEPGSEFDYGFDNSEPNWNMRIKSAVFSHTDGEQVKAGRIAVDGVAWNDGAARIDAVEWSTDDGRSWQRAELEVPGSKYAWYRWRAEPTFTAGTRTFACRAIDTLGRTQPFDGAIDWNPAGYGWHGVDRVTLEVV